MAPTGHSAGAARRAALFAPPLCWQVKWGADYLINAHVEDYVFMGSMGNQTEGEQQVAGSCSG